MPSPHYRKIFELDLDEYKPEPKDLDKLATVMSKKLTFFDKINAFLAIVKDSVPKIPAGYTYLAQFIAHDISFDSHSDRFLKEHHPWQISDVTAIRNKRKPDFNLETIYGYENPNEGEIPRRELMQDHDLPLLKIGRTEKNGNFPPFPCDLPRKDGSTCAHIIDLRNDENLLVAQTQVAFMKFHNAIVLRLHESGDYPNKQDLFDKARKVTIRYYQHIIFEDFLLRFIDESFRNVVKESVKSGDGFYRATPDDKFIPLEFSAAAFRMGHSMIKGEYDLNIEQNAQKGTVATLDEIMLLTGRGKMMPKPPLFVPMKLPSSWIINWYLFFEIEGSNPNSAETINTELPLALLVLRPLSHSNPPGLASSIAAFDLYRGLAFKLHAGQDVATAIGETPISPKSMGNLLVNKKIESHESDEEKKKALIRLRDAFSEKTPLWFYILAEAELQRDGKLGVVGGRIFAETIIKILFLSEFSILEQNWEPDELFLFEEYESVGMAEMLRFVRDTNKKYFKVLYPDMTDYFDELNPLEKPQQ